MRYSFFILRGQGMKKTGFFLEILITKFAMWVVGHSVYQRFAQKLGLKGQETVLDFGCGLGTVASYVAPMVSQGRLVCADISKNRLERCKKRLKHFRHVEHKNLQTDPSPFQAKSFDVIYCHFVLHELTEGQLQATLRQMHHWLKDYGKLYFREPIGDGTLHRIIDTALSESGFEKESSTITDIPIMGNAMEGSYSKKL